MSDKKTEFRKALEHTINYHSMEAGSKTPDFVLAEYLFDCLAAFDKAAASREAWYGRTFVPDDGPSDADLIEREACAEAATALAHVPECMRSIR